jgi:hypothetical protein
MAVGFVACLYLLGCNLRIPHDVKHSVLLYLGALCAALGLRCITRMLATDGRWYTVVTMRYADLCEVRHERLRTRSPVELAQAAALNVSAHGRRPRPPCA